MEIVAAPSILFLDEPTSGLDSATSYEVCALMKKIAKEQQMTVAAVIHSPSQQAFEQFDDLLLLGKGGRVIYFGPRELASRYFLTIGFSLSLPGANPADFFMDIASGKVKNIYPYKPFHLFYCWENYISGNDASLALATSRFSVKSGSERKKSILYQIRKFGRAVSDFCLDAVLYVQDVFLELGSTIYNLFVTDLVRKTPNGFVVFYLCFLRALKQNYSGLLSFLIDQSVHFCAGFFISLSISGSDYYGLLPPMACSTTPILLRSMCVYPYDQLGIAGSFVCLGILFVGIMAGGQTFGRERVVFWRETAAGMATIPYFFAKVFADVPKIVISACVYSLAVYLSVVIRTDFKTLFLLNIQLYFAAFTMGTSLYSLLLEAYSIGYFVSVILDKKNVAIAATGLSLLWSVALSGAFTPTIGEIMSDEKYSKINWLWELSPSRWFIEAFYLHEVEVRPWKELRDGSPLHRGYAYEHKHQAYVSLGLIGIGWMALALLFLKLVYRSKMK